MQVQQSLNINEMFNHIDTEYYEEEDSNRICDCCGDDFNDKKVHYNLKNIDFCNECWDDDKKTLINLKPIDRRNYTIEEKPKYWTCDVCSVPLGGGDLWFVDEKIDFDVCSGCKSKNKNYRDLFSVRNLLNKKNILLCNRTGHYVAVDMSDVDELEVPSPFEKEITEERMEIWIEAIGQLANLDKDFGPVKNWVCFTDLVEMPLKITASMALLVDRKTKRIASLVLDDHGRAGANIIYNTIEDYFKEKKVWESEQKQREEEKKKSPDLPNSYSAKTADILNHFTDFTGYIRLKRGLPIYYG